MIEVEIRGRLTDDERDRLERVLREKGTLLEKQDREMILLHGYSGYDKDPVKREVDVRLRNTNGSFELMVKRKHGDHNVSRHELSVGLAAGSFDEVKDAFKALGYGEGLWMHRKKEVYSYDGVEWSVVDVPGGLSYYEAEQAFETEADAEEVRRHLTEKAEALGLNVMGPEAMRDFIYELDAKVNKEVSW